MSAQKMNHGANAGSVLIIGAGASGLVALKEMREVGIDATCVEMASSVGGVFRKDAVYEGMHLTISNRFMAYSDFHDLHPVRYSTSDEYVEYLEKYVTKFRLWDRISFNSSVKKAKMTMGQWKVEIESEGSTSVRMVDRLIVATGSNQAPKYIPTPGFTGEVIHSNDFNTAAEFKDKRVLVIGIGESSADIVAEVSKVAKSCTNWSRRPLLIGPRWLNERSNDEQSSLISQDKGTGSKQQVWEFLETSTISKAANLLSPKMYNDTRVNFFKAGAANNDKNAVNLICRLALNGCESVPGGMERSDQIYVVTKSGRMPHAVASGAADLIVAKSVTYEGKKVRFDECLVKNFDTNPEVTQELGIDAIIMCTGFQTKLDWLEAPSLNTNCQTWFKNSIPPGYEDSLAFLGWTRPHQGGIPACSEMLCRYLALLYTGQRELPADWKQQIVDDAKVARSYYTQGAQYNTIVDYPAFMECMAKLIGCEPQPPSILNFRRFVQYYTFPFWPHFYRLNGVGAKPKVVDAVLADHGTFDAVSTPGWHPFISPTSKMMILCPLFLNPIFYLMSFLSKGNGFDAGWYWARSKKYAGLHGVRINAKDVFLPFLPWACLTCGVAYYGFFHGNAFEGNLLRFIQEKGNAYGMQLASIYSGKN